MEFKKIGELCPEFGYATKVSLLSFKRAYVGGVKSIVTFSKEEIAFKVSEGVVTFSGNNFEVLEIEEGDVYLFGEILSFSLKKEVKND